MIGEVTVECSWGSPIVSISDQPQLAYLLIEVKPTEAAAFDRMPFNICLVLDCCESANMAKLDYLKEGIRRVLDQLRPSDYLALVVFDEVARVIFPSRPVGQKADLNVLVDDIRGGSGRAISQGLGFGLLEIQKALKLSRVSRIVLLTDGQTEGDESLCEQVAADAGRLGAPITALGLGMDWNEKQLELIATLSGGHSDYVEKPEKIPQIFESGMECLATTAVRDVWLHLSLAKDVQLERTWQIIPSIAKRDFQLSSAGYLQLWLGDLEGNVGKAVLAKILLPGQSANCREICQVEVYYSEPLLGIPDGKVGAKVTLKAGQCSTEAQQYDPRVMNFVEKVTWLDLQT